MSLSNFVIKKGQKTKYNESELRDTRGTALRGVKAVSEMMMHVWPGEHEKRYDTSELTNEVITCIAHLIYELAEIAESCDERIDREQISIRKVS